MKSFLLVLVASLASSAQAAIFDCSVIQISPAGPKILGSMQVDSSKEDLKQVVINTDSDAAGCTGLPPSQGVGEQIACLFLPGGTAAITIRPATRQIPFAHAFRRNQRGELTTISVAGTPSDSKSLTLAVPGRDSVYDVSCQLAKIRR